MLGALDDMWFRWVVYFDLPGPDRRTGGKYLILPPGYDGPVPEGGYYAARSRTNGCRSWAAHFWRTRTIRSPRRRRS